MKNFVQPGETLTLAAPYAVNAGDGAKVSNIFGIACGTYANGAEGEFLTKGVFDVTTLGTDTPAVGAAAYWDDTNKRLTTTASTHMKVGVFVVAKANGPTVGRVRLNGVF